MGCWCAPTHGKAGEKREKEGKGRRKGRGKEWGGMEDRNSNAALLAYSSRFVDSNSLYGGWYWPQA